MSRIDNPKCQAVTQVQRDRARDAKDDPWAREVGDASGAGCGLVVKYLAGKYEEVRLKADEAESLEEPENLGDTSS